MVHLILFILASTGLAHIITKSTLFHPFREWVKTQVPEFYSQGIECEQCVGFWSGLIVGIILLPFDSWFSALIWGCAGSFVASLGNNVLVWLDSASYINFNPGDKN